ncbi:MAG: NAD-dependent epimerase/dehydratase family protein [Candidatus Saccharimonadales bacterium]
MAERAVLVTGACGFIGSFLVRRLLSQGWQVHLVLREKTNRVILDEFGKALHVHVHDGSTANLISIIKVAAPQAVFHLASLFLAQHTSNDIERLVQSNVLFSTQLAEAMAVNGVKLLVNTGTSWQHYEDMKYNPVCLYAALKQAYEAVLRFYVESCGLRVITLKLFDTYGPGDNRPKLLGLLRRTALSGDTLDMSPGEQLMDLVYIDDVIDAFVIAFERLQAGTVSAMEEYAVSSGTPISLREIAAVYAKVSGYVLNINWGGRDYRVREVMRPWTSFQILPGWQPRVDLVTGIMHCM